MTYLVLGICAIYIILMSLPYWAGLVEWITLRDYYLVLNGDLALLTLISALMDWVYRSACTGVLNSIKETDQWY